jgi:hypothetical protein
MKKVVLISFSLLFVAACQKNQISQQGSSLSVVIDGKTMVFKEIGIDSTLSYIGIAASVDTSASSPEISLTIFNSSPLTAGIYPVLTATSGSSQLNYYERSAGIITEYQSPDVTVTITSINSDAMVGTFQGTVDYALIDPNTFQVTLDPTRTKIMTSGKFNVRLR